MLAGVCADSETSKFCKTFCPSTIAHINHDFNESLGDVPPAAAAAAVVGAPELGAEALGQLGQQVQEQVRRSAHAPAFQGSGVAAATSSQARSTSSCRAASGASW
eukprot:CAMPEP_0194570664 /NCGR_PEP_ID=MMETSP0292-20121207/7898_1 /TAXON_ID=39354 /ORGANISM="Heterosigma akashiwo, Strain CCMP2393" /LENGTH=104 /DNA_ID=CAMNT_0039421177 /DNA_START=172 /DNA_END=484 /DNA_ORIENTATION=+